MALAALNRLYNLVDDSDTIHMLEKLLTDSTSDKNLVAWLDFYLIKYFKEKRKKGRIYSTKKYKK